MGEADWGAVRGSRAGKGQGATVKVRVIGGGEAVWWRRGTLLATGCAGGGEGHGWRQSVQGVARGDGNGQAHG